MHAESAVPTFFYYLHTKKLLSTFRYSVHKHICYRRMQLRTMERISSKTKKRGSFNVIVNYFTGTLRFYYIVFLLSLIEHLYIIVD